MSKQAVCQTHKSNKTVKLFANIVKRCNFALGFLVMSNVLQHLAIVHARESGGRPELFLQL
jgi:hypothetical protein